MARQPKFKVNDKVSVLHLDGSDDSFGVIMDLFPEERTAAVKLENGKVEYFSTVWLSKV